MQKKILIAFALIVIVAVGALFLPQPTRVYPDAAFANQISIAPPAEALTFARTRVDGNVQLLAVVEYRDNTVTALNLTELFDCHFEDPVDLFNALGYEVIRERIESEPTASLIKADVDTLILPLTLTDSHVAAGTNFAAHAEESSVEDGPFLFAKLVAPTPFNATVSAADGLRDFEVELAFVTLSETPLSEVPKYMGLILANDFTDRAKLLRHLNPDDLISGDGFTTGKSSERFLPVGNIFVIPSDVSPFLRCSPLVRYRSSPSMPRMCEFRRAAPDCGNRVQSGVLPTSLLRTPLPCLLDLCWPRWRFFRSR